MCNCQRNRYCYRPLPGGTTLHGCQVSSLFVTFHHRARLQLFFPPLGCSSWAFLLGLVWSGCRTCKSIPPIGAFSENRDHIFLLCHQAVPLGYFKRSLDTEEERKVGKAMQKAVQTPKPLNLTQRVAYSSHEEVQVLSLTWTSDRCHTLILLQNGRKENKLSQEGIGILL